jgi:hypothetical protein
MVWSCGDLVLAKHAMRRIPNSSATAGSGVTAYSKYRHPVSSKKTGATPLYLYAAAEASWELQLNHAQLNGSGSTPRGKNASHDGDKLARSADRRGPGSQARRFSNSSSKPQRGRLA